MKWLILAGLMGWPVAAGANAVGKLSNYEVGLGPALRMVMLSGEAQACGYRSITWAFEVNAAVQMAADTIAENTWNPKTEANTLLQVSKSVGDLILGAYAAGVSIDVRQCSTVDQSIDYSVLDKLAKIGGGNQ